MGIVNGKSLIIIGIFIVVIGSILYVFPNAFKWFGNLPGDIRIEKENSRFYFPIVTMLLISLAVNLLIRLIR